MGLTVGHAKNLTIADTSDTGVVRPSDWNSVHNVTLNLSANEVIKYVMAGATNNTISSGTVSFGDSNGVTFGLATSNGQITASVRTDYQSAGAYLTTAMVSNAGSNFVGLNSALTGNGVSATINSSGISLNVPAFLTTAQPVGAYLTTARASNDAIGLNTALTANGLSVTANSSGLSINVPAYLTTAAQSNHSHALATTTTNGSQVVVATSNSAGATLAVPPFITTYAAQTVQPVAYAVGGTTNNFSTLALPNSNGLSWSTGTQGVFPSVVVLTTAMASNAGSNFAGTNFAGTNATATLNSNGLSISVAGGGVVNQTGPNIADSAATITSGTVVFGNGGNVSFGLVGSTMTASAPSGGGGATVGGWEPNLAGNNTTFSSLGQNSLYLQKVEPLQNISFNNLEFRMSGSFVSTSVSHAVSHTISYGLYSLNTANDSYGLLGSSSIVINASNSSNASYAMTISQGATQFTNSSLGTVNASLVSGLKHLYLPYTGTLTAGINYGVAMIMSSTSTVGGSPLRIALLEQSIINNLTMGKLYASTALGSNASFVGDFAQGVLSATTGVLPSSIARSQLTNQVSQARLYLQFEV